MEYVILGLLLLRERTLYELNATLRDNISLFYSASFGSISVVIGKLAAKQWIMAREAIERGRRKKIYAITAAGKAAFNEWLMSPIPAEKVKDPALARLFFLGYLPPHQRIAVIEAHLAELELLQAALAEREQQAANLTIPAAQRDLAAFQRYTLRYGQEYYTFSSDWYRRLLAMLKDQLNDD